VCKIVLRDREQLAALDPFSNTILLSTLYWPDEVRSVADLAIPEDDAEVKPAELAIAEQLVAMMTSEFDPAAYRDEYREALMSIIEAKAAGEEIAEPVATPAAKLTDLVAALEASVAAAKAARQSAVPETIAEAAASKKGSRPKPVAIPAEAAELERATIPARRRKSA
jgi:DNA end-binding protein Ku